jgi:uncharacterized protein (TIGR03067 family)
MKSIIGMVVCLTLTVPAAVAVEKDDVDRRLDGTYQLIEALVNGKPLPGKEGVKQTVTIENGTITFAKGEEKTVPAAVTLDPNKMPAHIDMMPPNIPGVVIVKGIYRTKETDKGLELIIAHHTLKVDVRPTDFKGDGKGLVVTKWLRPKV